MQKTTAKQKIPKYDLYGDLKRIQSAIVDTNEDLKGIAGNMLTESLDNLKEKSAELHEGFSNYAADRPYKTIGVSLLAGALVGYLLRK